MSGTLSADEIERGLVDQGVPREKAKARALELVGGGAPTVHRSSLTVHKSPAQADRPAIEWPVTLLLPWSYLVSDNAKYVARIAGTMEKPVPKLNLSPEYRRGKGLVHDAARTKLGLVEPAAIPLALEARVWVPDDNRAHDVCNFAKCVHDALEDVVYTKDRWLHDIHWIRAGVDVDAPRCEIRIAPLLSSDPSPRRAA